jgi:hypothetical protein
MRPERQIAGKPLLKKKFIPRRKSWKKLSGFFYALGKKVWVKGQAGTGRPFFRI